MNLRAAFNQVRVLEKNGYGRDGEMVGFDVKAMRTQPQEKCFAHLENSKRIFESLLDVVRSIDEAELDAFRRERDYEGLEVLIVGKLMGRA